MSTSSRAICDAVRANPTWVKMLVSWRRESWGRQPRNISRFLAKQGVEHTAEQLSLLLIEMVQLGGAKVDSDGYYRLTPEGSSASIAMESELEAGRRTG